MSINTDEPEPAHEPAGRQLAVLLVDDDDIFLGLTTFELTRLGCDVTAVDDPEHALDILRKRDFDAVITDWQMPVIDGMELVRRARADGGPDKFRYVVLTTARAGSGTARTALEAGADGVLFKPLDTVQLELTIASIRRTVALQERLKQRNRHLALAHRRTREAFRKIEADIEAAATLHRGLLPRAQASDRVDFAWTYLPAQTLGGDTIGLVTLRNGATLFFIVDVRGHGVPAALASFHVHHRLIQLSPETPEALVAAIGTLNLEMAMQPDDTYCTLLCGLIDASGEQGWIVRAGHPQPFLIVEGEPHAMELEGNFPLGWFDWAVFTAEPFAFSGASALLLYSDGVTECEDAQGAELGTQGLADLLRAAKGSTLMATIAGIEDNLHARRGGGASGFEDDVSILALASRQIGETGN